MVEYAHGAIAAVVFLALPALARKGLYWIYDFVARRGSSLNHNPGFVPIDTA